MDLTFSRERNREHARRTRLRKKAQLQALQSRAQALEQEARALDEALVKIQLANILVEMGTPRLKASGGDASGTVITVPRDSKNKVGADSERPALQQIWHKDGNTSKMSLFSGEVGNASEGSPEEASSVDVKTPIPLHITVPPPVLPPRPHLHLHHPSTVNWKEGYVVDEDGSRRTLTAAELEELRRERNRMHAKMTRDRRKNLITSIENVSDNK